MICDTDATIGMFSSYPIILPLSILFLLNSTINLYLIDINMQFRYYIFNDSVLRIYTNAYGNGIGITTMSTIYDIAEKVGLSPSTVARALNGKGYCSRAAKEKILQIAQEMHYVPVQAAKSLKSKITRKIMMCIPDILNPYYFSMISSVNEVMANNQYHTILACTHHNAQKELEMIESLKERFVDGLIIGSFDLNNKLLQAMKDLGIPVVVLNFCNNPAYTEQFDCVYVDHTKAVQIATEHCIQKGHTRIAFLCDSLKEQTGRERLAGYRKALDEAQLSYDESLVIQSDHTMEGGYKAFSGFLDKKVDFTAVVSCNDLMGIACLNVCRERGLQMPDDFSIVTLDNTDYCLCTSPRLTSVNMMQGQMGLYAAQCILQQINEERDYKQMMVLTPRLVIRDSVKQLNV